METLIGIGIVAYVCTFLFTFIDTALIPDRMGRLITLWPVPQLRAWQRRAGEKWERVERGVIVAILFMLLSVLWPTYTAGVILFGVYKVLGGLRNYLRWRVGRVVKFFRKTATEIPEAKTVRKKHSA